MSEMTFQKKKLGGRDDVAQRKGGAVMQDNRAGAGKVLQDNRPVQRKPNQTGMPDGLKAGVENLSGMSMDHVRVHYNSAQPAQLNAHAYAQGSDIHLGPGQEKHLPHEAWHVVQQAQGRVKPTMQMKAGVAVNDDAGLEAEADVMGVMALRSVEDSQRTVPHPGGAGGTVINDEAKGKVDDEIRGGALQLKDRRSVSIEQREQVSQLVIQRGKSRKNSKKRVTAVQDDASDVDLHSDLDDSEEAINAAINKSYVSKPPLKKKKISRQIERVLRLRREIRIARKRTVGPRGRFVIKASNLQAILARLNLDYSSQNTTAIGIGGPQNVVVTKMGGANANYLGHLLGASVAVDKAKSSRGSNRHHAEKVLSLLAREAGIVFRRMIIDKARCKTCAGDQEITDSAQVIRAENPPSPPR